MVLVTGGTALVAVTVKFSPFLLKAAPTVLHGVSEASMAVGKAMAASSTVATGTLVLAGLGAAAKDTVEVVALLTRTLIDCSLSSKAFYKELLNIKKQLELIDGSVELRKMQKFTEIMQQGLKLVRKCNKVSDRKLNFVTRSYYTDKLKRYNKKLQRFVKAASKRT